MLTHRQDASTEYAKYHPPSMVEHLPPNSYLGELDPSTASSLATPKGLDRKEVQGATAQSSEGAVPHVTLCCRLSDFEAAAKSTLPTKSWVYASSSANSTQSLATNIEDWSRVQFRPRVLRNVEDVDCQSRILGTKSRFPFYVTTMGSLGSIHPEGEFEMARGACSAGMQMLLSTHSSRTTEAIYERFVEEKRKVKDCESEIHFQLYVPTDKQACLDLIGRAKKCGFKSMWVTVDTPVLGKRTADRYLQAQEALDVGLEEEEVKPAAELDAPAALTPIGGRPVPGGLSPKTTWEDLKWMKEAWGGPMVLKGIQTAEDARLAVQYGMDGIVLSNHGGRQAHTAPSALMTLCEIRTYAPEVLGRLEIFVDGGLRDGADVLKALCMGATAVGVGRPFLYALAAYGSKGVERCVDSKLPIFCVWCTAADHENRSSC